MNALTEHAEHVVTILHRFDVSKPAIIAGALYPAGDLPSDPDHIVVLLIAEQIACVERDYADRWRLAQYREEYASFRASLYTADHEQAKAMWARLDELMGVR